jgi:lipopolysaccharide export system ATP-binding protein
MIIGIISPDAGEILLDRDEITGFPMFQRARMGIGYLSQEPSVFRNLTVEENILAILETLPISAKDRRRRLRLLLDELRISHLAKNKAYTLSGGERRRLEITRSLVINPKYILLDEPFSGIDPIAVAECQGLVSELSQRKLGIILTDHNVRETLSITHRAYLINEGEIIISGSAERLVSDSRAREIYLGEKFRM